jgi:hypothetical protein
VLRAIPRCRLLHRCKSRALYCTSATSVIGHLAAIKLSTSTSTPQPTSSNATTGPHRRPDSHKRPGLHKHISFHEFIYWYERTGWHELPLVRSGTILMLSSAISTDTFCPYILLGSFKRATWLLNGRANGGRSRRSVR